MKTLGMAGLVALPVACCAGLPLLLAAGVRSALPPGSVGSPWAALRCLALRPWLVCACDGAPVNSSFPFQLRGVARERPRLLRPDLRG